MSNITSRKYRQDLKLEILTHYGKDNEAVCVKCGYDDLRALSIDHVNGRSKNDNLGGYSLYLYLRRNNYPLGYQTLCFNCQYIKRAKNKEYNNYRRT